MFLDEAMSSRGRGFLTKNLLTNFEIITPARPGDSVVICRKPIHFSQLRYEIMRTDYSAKLISQSEY